MKSFEEIQFEKTQKYIEETNEFYNFDECLFLTRDKVTNEVILYGMIDGELESISLGGTGLAAVRVVQKLWKNGVNTAHEIFYSLENNKRLNTAPAFEDEGIYFVKTLIHLKSWES